MKKQTGKVYLIGAGPGDPGLVTIKAVACIKEADVIVYDFLASPSLLRYAGETAEIIYVGKRGGNHTLTQDKINQLLAEKASQGLVVARLKGGDPFIFGRGGEEVETLINYHSRGGSGNEPIDFEIVPGVTSAIAAPAYAGIPLTHREHTSSVSLITGHEDPSKNQSSIHWESFAKSNSTLVFLMGVKNLPSITENLIRHGKAPNTPVALVRWGTTSSQETVTGTLDTIVAAVQKANLKPPAVIVVGDVVTLRDQMKWFEKKPLLGKTIAVTRARHQASELVAQLEALGAECIEAPAIAIVPPEDPAPLENSIKEIESFDWLVFTSVNGVKFFFSTLFALGRDARSLGHLKVACIGPATRDKLMEFGIISDILPKTYRAESVVEAFSVVAVKEKKVLLPRAREARSILPEELEKMGAEVCDVAAYETRQVSESSERLVQRLEKKEVDLVTFTSSSTVTNFKAMLPDPRFEELVSGVSVASIGPITSATAREIGIPPDIEADVYTIPGLVEAIAARFSATSREKEQESK
ncbi:MAG TPA: uroporphyrinogen-III C-methyltransferase [Desulfobacteraceae bacterium]|nr:uroporphyrinogen-III C-methyltransferase [Desulfobacteraceae bacterium]